jgi:hypothetical protein
MANKQDFKPEEWVKILQSPMLVGIAVSMADPSGLWGALKEAAAGSAEIGTAKRDDSANALINAVITDINTQDGRSALQNALKNCFAGAEPAQCVERSLANLREISAILDEKAPVDAVAFKAWLCAVSQKVAEASTEGAFLGFGGAQVSDAEKATLADISKALRMASA